MEAQAAPLFERPEATLEQVALADISPWRTGGARSRSAKSVAALGLRGVVELKRLPPGGRYRFEVVDGSRRLNNARDAGLEIVNAEVLPADTDRVEAAALRLMLNLGRSPNPLQEAEALKEVFDAYRAEGVPAGAIARRFGLSTGVVRQRLGLLALPVALQAGVADGKVAAGVAARIANLPRAQQERLVVELAERGKLTGKDVKAVRQAKQAAVLAGLPDALFGPPENARERAKRALQGFLDEGVSADELIDQLRELTGKAVF